ncbi:hypothetical protein V8F06_007468 [Rhypophila decipiens]
MAWCGAAVPCFFSFFRFTESPCPFFSFFSLSWALDISLPNTHTHGSLSVLNLHTIPNQRRTPSCSFSPCVLLPSILTPRPLLSASFSTTENGPAVCILLLVYTYLFIVYSPTFVQTGTRLSDY